MEENTARMDEIQEIETVEETEEVTENTEICKNGAMVAGFVGGVLAYVVIKVGGKVIKFTGKQAKKLWRKIRHKSDDVIEAEIVEEDPDAVSEQENTKK